MRTERKLHVESDVRLKLLLLQPEFEFLEAAQQRHRPSNYTIWGVIIKQALLLSTEQTYIAYNIPNYADDVFFNEIKTHLKC